MRLLPLALQHPRRTVRRHRSALSLILLVAIALWLLGFWPSLGTAPGERPYTLVLGSYGSKVHAVSFDPPSEPSAADGKLGLLRVNEVGERPSWLCAHPTLPDRAYGVLERADGRAGRLVALRLGGPSWWRRRGHVSVLDEVASGGQEPAHCAVTPDGSHLVVANYGSGTVVFQPLEPLGLFFGPAAVHTLPRPDAFAPGRNPTRQKEAHPHQILPLGRDVWVVDLGNDCLWRYRTIRERADSWAVSKVELERAVEGAHGGDGWRHAVFGPSGRDIYVLTEMSLEVLHYRFSTLRRPLLVSRTALGPAKSPESAASGAELLYLPPAAGDSSGALLASTRKSTPAGQADDLLWLPLSEDGAVVANELQRVSPTRGQSLRGATVTADGLYLFVAGQTDGSLTVWGRSAAGPWREVAPPLTGLARPTSVLVVE